jgi:hypothetical protein
MTKEDLRVLVIEALNNYGGQASIVQVCTHVWNNHREQLEASGDLFYTWQYDIRWAAQALRDEKIMHADELSPRGIWRLAKAEGVGA